MTGLTADAVHPLTEFAAIRAAQEGDRNAFAFLYNLHSRRVYRVILRILRNDSDAEDLTQRVFLRLFRKIGTFRGESRFSTWLHRMAVNAALMHLRRERLDEAHTQSLDAEERSEFAMQDGAMRGAADRVSLARALRKLPAGCRRMFLLHAVLGYEHQEIATLESCSVGCSKSQVHKARKRLQVLLAQFRQISPSQQAAD